MILGNLDWTFKREDVKFFGYSVGTLKYECESSTKIEGRRRGKWVLTKEAPDGGC